MAIIFHGGEETSYWRRDDVYSQDHRPRNQIPKCFYGWVEISKEEYEKAEREGKKCYPFS